MAYSISKHSMSSEQWSQKINKKPHFVQTDPGPALGMVVPAQLSWSDLVYKGVLDLLTSSSEIATINSVALVTWDLGAIWAVTVGGNTDLTQFRRKS